MDQLTREVLGYLNFSRGTPDPKFQKNLNDLMAADNVCCTAIELHDQLAGALATLREQEPAFSDAEQADAVVSLTLRTFLDAYREHHADLLFHLDPRTMEHPFLLARMFEAVIACGGPWDETERIIESALDRINDFIGYRPVAVLENDRRMEPYGHERYRPIPLFLRGAGVAAGRYHELIESTLAFLGDTDPDLLADAWFDLDHLDELALDVRPHDHSHPVNKRTNYMFGEWDPHQIDNKGYYRRFVVRRIILDALVDWLDNADQFTPEENLFDASAVLSGTILMASSISGAGPNTYDSSVSLSALLPRVARQRDSFYARLMQRASGERLERLRNHEEVTRQPFGHVRQQLNMYVAGYGARQVQHRQLAWLYARIGFDDASREEALVIPALSARFETEIQLRVTSASRHLTAGALPEVLECVTEIEELIGRGVECGGLVDPWNILAFQGQFPLFSAREDAIPDSRIEVLMDLLDQIFDMLSRALGEAAAQGDNAAQQELSGRFERLAEWWDRFATIAVEDLPHVAGRESFESARQVAAALAQWQQAGSASGDIAFWREHVQQFASPRAFALVVEALLAKRDHVAAMGLMMQWLSEAESSDLEAGPHSIHTLLVEWMQQVTGDDADAEQMWPTIRRLFDFLEANAGECWNAPTLLEYTALMGAATDDLPPRPEGDELIDPLMQDETSEDDLFQAAYDDVVYRDSADDGQAGETMDSGFAPGTTEYELINRQIEPRLTFLQTLFRLWQMAAVAVVRRAESLDALPADEVEVVRGWQQRAGELQRDLVALLRDVWDHEPESSTGDLDLNVEYDIQLQARYLLLHSVIGTTIACVQAQRLLSCIIPEPKGSKPEEGRVIERRIAAVYRSIVRRDRRAVRRHLPPLLEALSERPLLYVPFENGGQPARVFRAKSLQALVRFLLTQLPGMGMLRETLDVLRTAFRMERTARPAGFAVTEFDRLFRIALENSLKCLIDAWARRRARAGGPHQLAEYTAELVEHYTHLWTLHSNTMRLSTIEELRDDELADEVREFIETYGADLFHTRMLTLGNVRTILHQGIDRFLEYLEEEADPLRPVKLVEDIRSGQVDAQDSMDYLEVVYEAVVDRFDRFLEYNTTTTQSDYGEKFFSFLDFLRLEAAYDRDAWTLTPMRIAHEVLVRSGQVDAALMWEHDMRLNTAEMAESHVDGLTTLERSYGMRLPSLRDRISERFTKPLVVNRMLALIPRAIEEAPADEDGSAFAVLRTEINAYVDDTFGSGIDIPQWLQAIEQEVSRHERDGTPPADNRRDDVAVDLPLVNTRFSDVTRQLELLAEPEPEKNRPVTRRRRRRRPDHTDRDQK